MARNIDTIRADAIRASARILKQRLDLIGKWVSEEEALLLARKAYIAHEMALWRDVQELDPEEVLGEEPKGFLAKRAYRQARKELEEMEGNYRPKHQTLDELDALNKEWFFSCLSG